MEWCHVGDDTCQSSWPELLVVSQTFVIVQVPSLFLLAPSSSGCAKTYHMFKREEHSQDLDVG